MAITQNVYIYTDHIDYDPIDAIVRPGDTVYFILRDWPQGATVDFGSSSPFGQVHQLFLNGAIQQMSQQNQTVANVTQGRYSFTVTYDNTVDGLGPSQSATRMGMDPEPPTAQGGDLEVVSDPPPKDR